MHREKVWVAQDGAFIRDLDCSGTEWRVAFMVEEPPSVYGPIPEVSKPTEFRYKVFKSGILAGPARPTDEEMAALLERDWFWITSGSGWDRPALFRPYRNEINAHSR